MKAQVFVWDWKETPPIAAIVNAAAKIKGAKAWEMNECGDTYVMVVAKDKATAREAYNKYWGEPTEGVGISLWEDEA